MEIKFIFKDIIYYFTMDNNTNKVTVKAEEAVDIYYQLYNSCIKYKKETNKKINCEKYYKNVQTIIDNYNEEK